MHNEISNKTERLLKEMTPEEKAGQMTQVNLNLILKGGYKNTDGAIDNNLLKKAVNQYKAGSFLNVINQAYSLETWHSIITHIQDAAMKNEPAIPVIYGIDAIHGANYILGATLFPHNIGTAATRNPSLAHEIARATARQTRASGVRWNFDPVLDIGRNPLWPRFEETFGEDPIIVTQMTDAAIEGYQGKGLEKPDAVACTIKHFLGYSEPRTGWDRTPALIPEIHSREYEFPQYKSAIKKGAASLMVNSGVVNGIPMHANKYMLTDVLRGEMGFEGVVVTDWEDINRLHERHNIAANLEEAVYKAVMAGIDMSMTPHDFIFTRILSDLYRKDEQIARRVDESVRRILSLKFRLGLFDNPYPEQEAIENFHSPHDEQLALQAAKESITLLKNKKEILPLQQGTRILLAGPSACNISSLHGSWSYTWQGTEQGHYPTSTQSIYQALQDAFGKENVSTFCQSEYKASENTDTRLLKKHAENADVIILAVGEDAYAESPGSDVSLTLDIRQTELIKAANATGKPVVLILIQGRPRIITEADEKAEAVIMAYRPASKGAEAIAEVLAGNFNPSGKLPFSYPRHTNHWICYDHKWTELNIEASTGVFSDTGYHPLYPFGYGLSYTKFTWSDFSLDKTIMRSDEAITASITITNSGHLAGEEVVELYSRQIISSVVPSMRKLRKFSRFFLEPGQQKRVHFTLYGKDLAYPVYTDNHHYEEKLEPGEIQLIFGALGFELITPKKGQPPFVARGFKNALTFRYDP